MRACANHVVVEFGYVTLHVLDNKIGTSLGGFDAPDKSDFFWGVIEETRNDMFNRVTMRNARYKHKHYWWGRWFSLFAFCSIYI